MSNKKKSKGDRTVRAAVIGAGIGTYHIEAYQEHSDAQVTALCDIDKTTLKETCQEYGIENGWTDHEEMLQQADIDCVSVCVPNKLHAPVVIDCLQAGKDVLCEKPLARTAAEGKKMLDAADDAGKKLMVQFNNRYRPEAEILRGYADDGVLGDIYFARCGWIRRNGIPGWGSWFTTEEMAGGGPLIDLAVHMLDLTIWLMGNPEPKTVLASTYAKFGPDMEALGPWGTPDPDGTFDVEDMAVAMIKFAAGQTIALEASWASRCEREWVYSTLMGENAGASLERVFEIDGEDDTAIDTLELYTQEQGTAVDRTVKVQPDPAMGRRASVEHFVDCLIDDSVEMISPATDGLRIMRILDAAYESAETDQAVEL